MAGFRPIELGHFYARLHARGLDTAALAAAVGRNRSTVTRVLNGSRRRGPVWAKLQSILTSEELRLIDVAQCSTWNTAHMAKRPRWASAPINVEGKVAA